MILQCSHIDKAFSTDVILSDISFHINEHEKAAIVGANGSGKSTLLKIITGHLSADNGEVILSGSTTVGYLAQNQEYASEHSIYDEMRDAKPEIIQLEQQMEKLSARMDIETGETLEQVIKQYDNARQRYERLDGYAYQSELVGVLKGLGFSEEDFEKPVISIRWRKDTCCSRQDAVAGTGSYHIRRAYQPSGYQCHCMAGILPDQLSRCCIDRSP